MLILMFYIFCWA